MLAGYLQEAGNTARAVQVLEAVIAAHPDYAEAYNSLGVILMRQGQHERARAALRKVLELDPTSAKAYENLAADELAARRDRAGDRGSDAARSTSSRGSTTRSSTSRRRCSSRAAATRRGR